MRHEDGVTVTADDIKGLAAWDPKAEPDREIAFRPSRVLLQDFTGVPAIVDLAAMRDAMKRLGGDPRKINPLQPVELVIDHSVQVDEAGTPQAFAANAELEFQRNRERYAFLRWGQNAFDNFRVVPPDTGIVHQVNLEYLARVVFDAEDGEAAHLAYPDTLVGTDSHTTMINGLGVLGWGVGGIEAEAAMLGQPVSMLVPQVVGFKLTGTLPRRGDRHRPGADRHPDAAEEGRGRQVRRVSTATAWPACRWPTGPRSPTWPPSTARPAGCSRSTPRRSATSSSRAGRPSRSAWSRRMPRPRGCSTPPEPPEAEYSDTLELDLSTVEPSLAGPRRPQDRVPLHDAKASFADGAQGAAGRPARQEDGGRVVAGRRAVRLRGRGHGDRRRPSRTSHDADAHRPRRSRTARS